MKKILVAVVLAAICGAPAAAQNPGRAPVEVSLRVVAGRLMVPVRAADGTELEFMLSTSTLSTVFSQSTAARLGDPSGLTLGGLPVNLDHPATIPDDDLTVDGNPIAGIIGPQTLNEYDVLIDAPGGRLALRPVGRRAPWDGVDLADPVPVRVFHGVLIAMDVTLNGRQFFATLDLGTSRLIVNTPAAEKLSLGTEGVGTLGVGAVSLADLALQHTDLPTMERWDPNAAGFVVVGAVAALDCAIAISWVRSEIQTCTR